MQVRRHLAPPFASVCDPTPTGPPSLACLFLIRIPHHVVDRGLQELTVCLNLPLDVANSTNAATVAYTPSEGPGRAESEKPRCNERNTAMKE